MSIERQFGTVFYVCDECGESGPEDDVFSSMTTLAKQAGWLAMREDEDDDWVHMCPDCVKLLPTVGP